MASNLSYYPRATAHSSLFPTTPQPRRELQRLLFSSTAKTSRGGRVKAVLDNNGESYLDMWKNAVDRENKSVEFQNMAERLSGTETGGEILNDDFEKKTEDFKKIVEYSKEERDRIQRMQVVDRAAAAIAAARAIIQETRPVNSDGGDDDHLQSNSTQGTTDGSVFVSQSETSGNGAPGPDFWSWTPPPDDRTQNDFDLMEVKKPLKPLFPRSRVAVKDRSSSYLDIPLQSKLSPTGFNSSLPPLQSLMEVKKEAVSESSLETPSLKEEERELDLVFMEHAIEAGYVLATEEEDKACSGVEPDGSRWWKEKGIERRPDGVICRWTMLRGVSVDQDVEWQEKYWEAADAFGHKELGSEKSGRDATGNVWREYWKESMWQESGLVHFEKTADKWGKNGTGDEWQEKWWEHYDASNKAEKWAHKWCTIDPNTQLEAGHAHAWHERWGEKYDGYGGSIKYTDKWAERCEGDDWTKWGDKWDEHFDPNGHGVKQGETWWAGKHGERWNRTWGEQHNGSGWVHKYGKSSSGEHWDTHEEQETWYEKFPHYGFYHCFENSNILREVQVPSDSLEP
ncbi:protein LIKE EARLY STARVATION, chloroplastic [Mercurialis annua]|uniref:protein LIKE EARLY STARVATION, chloroplastic n=1 Tax=Mercurialis annua TaxID=3986 RepID=UPI00215EEB36|nr:protein LIKE EARLY STARVATION, chloroplastic [Mercurialis annua]